MKSFLRGFLVGLAIVVTCALLSIALDLHTLASPPSPSSPAVTPAPLQEDDPGWDCATMGDKLCGPGLSHGNLDDQQRPACFVEPSSVPAGFEVIYYPHLSMVLGVGFEVTCP
jgi:hypothetical protein